MSQLMESTFRLSHQHTHFLQDPRRFVIRYRARSTELAIRSEVFSDIPSVSRPFRKLARPLTCVFSELSKDVDFLEELTIDLEDLEKLDWLNTFVIILGTMTGLEPNLPGWSYYYQTCLFL